MLLGLSRITADLVEGLLEGEQRGVIAVRAPTLEGVPLDGHRVLVVTSDTSPPTPVTPDVTVVRITTTSGRAVVYRLEPEPTDLGELTPGLLRELAYGGGV